MDARDVEVLDRRTVYQGFFRLDRYRLRHRRFAGTWTRDLIREVFERGHAVGVLLYDPALDMVVLVEQFRPGPLAAGRPPWMLELPAGVIGAGETAEAVARREVLEETGCAVGQLVRIGEYFPSPGGCSETTTLFYGTVDASAAGGCHGLEEEGEDIRVVVMPAAEAEARLDSGDFANSLTLVGLGWLGRHRQSLRDAWTARQTGALPEAGTSA